MSSHKNTFVLTKGMFGNVLLHFGLAGVKIYPPPTNLKYNIYNLIMQLR